MGSVPVVDYLVLDGEPHLVGQRCDGCGATFLGRRNACGSCGGTTFTLTPLATQGFVESYTIVHRGAPAPFVSALVHLDDGAYVKANLLGVEPSPDAVDPSIPVILTTFTAATGADGTEAIAFGFAHAGQS